MVQKRTAEDSGAAVDRNGVPLGRACLSERYWNRTVSAEVGSADHEFGEIPVSTDQYGNAPAQPAYQPVPQQPAMYAPQPVFVQAPPSNGIGIAGFVTGLLGLVLCWVPWLGVLLAGVGIVLSGIGISTGKKKGASTGLAIAGLVCGILALIPAIIILVALLSVASEIATYTP